MPTMDVRLDQSSAPPMELLSAKAAASLLLLVMQGKLATVYQRRDKKVHARCCTCKVYHAHRLNHRLLVLPLLLQVLQL
jgi:hypothetical protein